MMRRLAVSSIALCSFLLFAGCAHKDVDVRVHWIEQNESAPFSGLLMDKKTYRALREKLIECGE